EARLLFRDETRMQLTPRAVDVLLALVERRGAPIGRQELFSRVWSDTAVEDGTLSSHISIIRKALDGKYIETIPKRGYRFVGTVDEVGEQRSLLVVLPFENLGGGREDDAFSDGLTDEMITQLGRLNPSRLGVIARTSSMTYRSTDKTVAQIGRELGVAYVLDGSVRRAGDRVRITAQLIAVRDQTHLWADNYESGIEDILTLQSRVSRAVAGQIEIRLLPGEATRLDNVRQVVPAAYEACLTGRYLWNRRDEQALERSIALFEEAIEKDPRYAPAYAGLADSHLTRMDSGYVAQSEAMSRAIPALAAAVRLDESLAEAHVSLGHAAMHQFEWPTAQRELLRAIELNPSYAAGHFYYANYLAAMQRLPEAIEVAERAVRLDPVSAVVHSNLSTILWLAGDAPRSMACARMSLELNPSSTRAREDLGRVYEERGEFDRAIAEFRKALAIEPDADGTLTSLGHAFALAGRPEEAKKVLRRLERLVRTRFVGAYSFALVHLALGAVDEAFTWLGRACDERSSSLPFLRVNPRLAALHGDPRFAALCRRVFGE
ncbi:MAG: tetratricopeptide repeat protein, partial [Acidobacteriota bacterium]